MPDDDILRATTSVDVSGVQAGMAEVVNVTRSGLAQVKAEYKSATDALKQATADLTSAQQQLGAAAKNGNQAAIAVINEYQAAATKAAAAVKTLEGALNSESTAASNAARNTQQLGSAHAALVPQVAAASAAIRVFEGNLPIRAVERFLTTIPGMGAALQAAFPVVGAIAVGELLAKIVGEVEEWALGMKEVERWNETVGQQIEQQEKMTRRLAASTQQAQLQIVGITEGTAAEYRTKARIADQEAVKAQASLNSWNTELAKAYDKQRELLHPKATESEVDAMGVPKGTAGAEVAKAKALEDSQRNIQKIATEQREANAALTEARLRQALLIRQADDEDQKEREKAARESSVAYRAAEAERRKRDQDALTDLRTYNAANHIEGQAALQSLATLLEAQLAASKGYVDRERAIRAELARVYQESERLNDQQIQKSITAFEHGQRLAEQATRKVGEEYRRRQALERESFEKSLRDTDAALKRQNEEIVQKLEASIDAQSDAVKMRQVSGDYARMVKPRLGRSDLNPFGGGSELSDLKQQQNIENELLKLEIERARVKAMAEGDPNKALELQRKVAELESELERKRIQDQTQRLAQSRQAYQQYFNTINQGFTRAVNQWIETGHGFGNAMRQMLVGLTEQFADFYIQLALKAAESWLQQKIVALITQGSQAEAQVASNAAVGASAAAASAAILGPGAAAAAGAATYTEIEGTWAPLAVPFYEQGGLVPSMGMAMLHPQEMVLPAPIANHVMNSMGGNSSKNSTFNANINATMNGITDAGFHKMLDRHADRIAVTVMKAARRSNLV